MAVQCQPLVKVDNSATVRQNIHTSESKKTDIRSFFEALILPSIIVSIYPSILSLSRCAPTIVSTDLSVLSSCISSCTIVILSTVCIILLTNRQIEPLQRELKSFCSSHPAILKSTCQHMHSFFLQEDSKVYLFKHKDMCRVIPPSFCTDDKE